MKNTFRPSALVIEDDAGTAKVLAKHLEKRGFEVITAANGIEGLGSLMLKPNINLIILDLIMPKCDGFTVLKVLEEKHTLSKAPPRIIVHTQVSEYEQLKSLTEHHCVNSVRRKPLPISQLDQDIDLILKAQGMSVIHAATEKQEATIS